MRRPLRSPALKPVVLTGIAALLTTSTALVAGSGSAAASGDVARDLAGESAWTAVNLARAAVSRQSAVASATDRHRGQVVDSHLQDEGRLVWEVVTAGAGGAWEVQVDAASGAVVGDQRDE